MIRQNNRKDGKEMKKILRTITKTSRRIVICHENLSAANDGGEALPAFCPNCGEPILPANTSALLGEPQSTDEHLIENETDHEWNSNRIWRGEKTNIISEAAESEFGLKTKWQVITNFKKGEWNEKRK